MTAQARVFLVDDQAAVLKALSRLLTSAGVEVVCFGSAREFLESGNTQAPGCLVLDLSMPHMDGLTLQNALAEHRSLLPVIFLTGNGDLESGVQAMKHGAVDFLTKPVDGDKLLAAVHAALGKNRLARLQQAELAAIHECLATLTPREHEVLALVVQGRLNKQIAAELGTVEKTVKVHRARVMEKMKARTLAELVRLADRAGIRGPEVTG